MKPYQYLRNFLAALGSFTLAISSASAAVVTWDSTPGTVSTGNSTVTGGAGTRDTTNGNWTAVPEPSSALLAGLLFTAGRCAAGAAPENGVAA